MEAYELTRERVRQAAPQDQPGFYRLGYIINGRFFTSYVGRSDTCLRTRLIRHTQRRWQTHFVSRPTKTLEEAYYQECLFYHLERKTTGNKVHPARPAHTDLYCPYCEHEKTLATEAHQNTDINNVN
ncbi:hypothetical protein HAL_39480 [Haladaptatus sp. T7]|nr:hypothetical protein HAL_39480 [Haladaptatus sp. T7]